MALTGFVLPSLADANSAATQRFGHAYSAVHASGCPRASPCLARRHASCSPTLHESLRSSRSSVHKLSRTTVRSLVKTRAVASEIREETSQPTTSSASDHAQAASNAPSTPIPSTPTPAVPAEASSPQQQDTQPGIQPGAPQQQQTELSSPYQTDNRKNQWRRDSAHSGATSRHAYKGNRQWDSNRGNPQQLGGPGGRQQGPPPTPVPSSELGWLKPGQPVLCKVVFSNPAGFKVAMVKDERIGGWCPIKEAPYLLRDENDETLKMDVDDPSKLNPGLMPVGTIREFYIVKTPPDLMYNGVGPLVSARLHDLKMLWKRIFQLFEACNRDKETFRVKVLEANQGGLVTRILSLQGFIPISQLVKDSDSWLSEQDMQALIGKEVDVTMIEVEEEFKKIVLSMSRAQQYTQLRTIHLGALMWGEVRRIEEFGAFIGLDGTRISGLLHISNISRSRVETVDEVFHLGERVRCLVMGMDDNFTRISLSTAELEEQNGDMLYRKDEVYANAEKQAKLFMAYVQSSQDNASPEDFDFDGDQGVNDRDFAAFSRN